MFKKIFKTAGLPLVFSILILAVLSSDKTVEGIGDRVQIALPLTGLACAVAGGEGVRYFGRYLATTAIYTTSKRRLGDAQINERPRGGYKGFPSGHTTAATFGAVGMTQTCLKNNKLAQGVTIIAAGFVGGSRVESGAHTLYQVLGGALLGWIMQIAALSWFDRGVRRAWDFCARGIRRGRDKASAMINRRKSPASNGANSGESQD